MAAENTLRYTKVDYSSHRDALIQRIRSRWANVWNDFLSNSFAMLLVDLMSFSAAAIAYSINRLAGEFFITTMTLRESAVRVGALVGYQLRGPLPSILQCEAALTTPASASVTIAKNTLIRIGDDGIPFEIDQDYVIGVGKLSPETLIVQLSSGITGSKALSTNVLVTGGSTFVDLIDTTINLTQYITPGESFRVLPLAAGTERIYTIQAIESAPGAVSFNRLVITPAWAGQVTTDVVVNGAVSEVQAEVYDRRIGVVQGQTVLDQYVTPTVESPSYVVKLSRAPIIDGSVVVAINSEPWTQTTALSVESSSSKVFQVKTLPSGQTLIQFGDGQFGQQVPQDAVVLVQYRVGGGVAGNIPIGSVNVTVPGTSVNGLVVVPLRNDTAPGQGGRDAETLEEARTNIPYYTRTNDRAVTLDDYQTIAQLYKNPQGSVAYARAAIRTENSLLEGNIVVVYAWTTGSLGSLVPLQPQLKSSLRDYLQAKAVGTDYVLIADGTERPVPVSLRFKVFDGFDVVSTASLVSDTIRKFITDLRPGNPVLQSNLLRSVDEVHGVDTVTMSTPISDLTAANPTELFTAPSADYVYTLDRVAGVLANEFLAQLPASPLAAWSFRAFLADIELSVIPDVAPGYARLLGSNLLTSPKSTVNLLTGQARFYTTTSGDFQVKLIPVQGYDRERPINVYIGYSGDNSQTKRREIRAALRAWSDNLGIGAAIYAGDVTRPVTDYDTPGISVSKSNVAAVVKAVTGVSSVNRVALDTPANVDDRITASDFELLKLGLIVLNNQND